MIKEVAIREIQSPTWAITEQFLQVHSVITNPAELSIGVSENGSQCQIAYFPVKDEKFFFAIEVENDESIVAVFSHPFISVALNMFSKTFNSEQMTSLIDYIPIKSWNKGDRWNGDSVRVNSKIIIDPNPLPDSFGNKLSKLLEVLQSRATEIKAMPNDIEMLIQVTQISHNGNGSIDGLALSASQLTHLAKLEFAIDFDLYAEGKSFKD